MAAVGRTRAIQQDKWEIINAFLKNKTKRYNHPGLDQSRDNQLDCLQPISQNIDSRGYKRQNCTVLRQGAITPGKRS